jgi:macrolide-specific efflux system membrane fusion protein
MSSTAARPAEAHTRWIRWVALLAVVAGIGATATWWFGFRKGGPSAGAAGNGSGTTITRIVDATSGPVADTVSATGTVAAATTDDLSFTAGGQVTAVNVAVGDTVTAGQVLATIDPTELQAAYDSALANVATAQAKLDDDTEADASAEQLAADDSALKVAYDAAVTASTNLAGAQLTATTDGTVTAVNLTVGQQLGSGGTSGTTVSGSATGGGSSPRAVGSSTGNGQSTGVSSSASSTAQIEVVSTGKYAVDLSVDTTDIAKVATGQQVSLDISTNSSSTSNQSGANRTGVFPGGGGNFPTGGNFPGGGAATPAGRNGTGQTGTNGGRRTGTNGSTTAATAATATGTVADVSKIATATSGVASYTVTVDFDGDPTKVFIGSSVTAEITTSQHQGVLVPALAVTTTGATSSVLVSTDGTEGGTTERRTVTTGATVGNEIEITSGLQAGEHVVIEITSNIPAGEGGFPGGRRTGEGGSFFPGGGRNGEGGAARGSPTRAGQPPASPSTTVAG